MSDYAPDVPEGERQEIEAREAFIVERNIKQAMADGRDALWRLAENLYRFDEMQGWLKLGHDNKSQWLADAEVTLTRPTYERYVQTWRKLVIERQIPADRLRQLDQSKVAIVTKAICANSVLVDEALADAESLAASDLREKYYGPKEQSAPAPEPEPEPELVAADEAEIREVAAEYGIQLSDPKEDYWTGMNRLAQEVNFPVIESVVAEGEVIEVQAADNTSVIADGYDFPAWVTRTSVEAMLADLKFGIDSGATFPRLSRQHCQVAVELAKAFLEAR